MNRLKTDRDSSYKAKNENKPYRMRLPRFILEDDIGLGDAIKQVTYTMGIRPTSDCGCEHRATLLNRWVVFSRRH